MFKDHIQRVNNAGDKTQDRQQYIQPKMTFKAYFHKNTNGRQQDGKKNFNGISRGKWHSESLLQEFLSELIADYAGRFSQSVRAHTFTAPMRNFPPAYGSQTFAISS
jgi:hypothetical protein